MKKRLFAILLLAAMILSSCRSGGNGDMTSDTTPTTTPAEEESGMDISFLAQSGKLGQRWLSLPMSRLVINPYNFNSPCELTHGDYSDRDTLPLNIGYLDPYSQNGSGRWLENLLTVYEHSEGEGDSEVLLASPMDDDGWTVSGGRYTELDFEDGCGTLTVKTGADAAWQFAARNVSFDYDDKPQLIVTVPECTGAWALKICESGGVDAVIQSDTSKTGSFTYDIAAILGKSGSFRGSVKLFSIGYNKTLTFSRLDIRTPGEAKPAAEKYTVGWTPEALDFTASYKNGLSISGFDTFRNTDTVVRSITAVTGGSLKICGMIIGKATVADGALTVECDGYSYTVTPDRDTEFTFYSDQIDMLTGASIPSLKDAGAFSFTLELEAGERMTVAVSLRSDAGAPDRVAVSPEQADEIRRERAEYWSDYLAIVPHPETFDFEFVDAKGVTPDEVKQYYYISWVFLAQNILPPNPELDFDYPQVCCGKPSMWGYGDRQSAYSASWESFFGMQLLGYVMPDVAWDALTGLMSLVGEDGMLGGESLPSEKAHTAYLLYALTGDAEALEGVRENIGRYLDWRIDNPRWIYLDHNDVNAADADFVESALVDIGYMIKICEALGKTGEADEWQDKYDAFLQKYYEWFFDAAGNTYQYCDKISFTRSAGCTVWVTKGLLIEGLDATHRELLMKRFRTEYEKNGSFCGFSGVKYPVTSHTVRGLAKCGYDSLAMELTEACARDVVRVGMLAENYTDYPDPVPTGVRPALFGCAMMIDAVLTMNGYMYYDGETTAVDLGQTGGVTGIRIRDEVISVSLD